MIKDTEDEGIEPSLRERITITVRDQGIEPRQPKQVVYSHPGTPVPHTTLENQEALTLGRDRLRRVNFPYPYGMVLPYFTADEVSLVRFSIWTL